MTKKQTIHEEKTVIKGAEAVWGANKYFVLACSQRRYLKIREHFKNKDLHAAFRILKQTDHEYEGTPSDKLPELDNALYHILGYFKKKVSDDQRQMVNDLIPNDPIKALNQLERWTHLYEVDYLKPCRLWKRGQPFQLVPISIPGKKVYDRSERVMWEGDYLSVFNE